MLSLSFKLAEKYSSKMKIEFYFLLVKAFLSFFPIQKISVMEGHV
jgi:hypothetical protein